MHKRYKHKTHIEPVSGSPAFSSTSEVAYVFAHARLAVRRKSLVNVDHVRRTALDLLPRRSIPFVRVYERHKRIHVELILSDPERRSAKLSRTMQIQFYEAARTECGLSKTTFSERFVDYNIHHKKPRGMGGNNDFENLVLIDRALHTLIHLEINNNMWRALDAIHECNAGGHNMKWLRAKIERTKGININRKNNVLSIVAPWPKGKVCIPSEIIRQELPEHAKAILSEDSSLSQSNPEPQKPHGHRRRQHRYSAHSRQ